MASERRSEKLKAVCEKLNQVHNEWAADENRPNPDEEYFDAAVAVLNSFGRGTIPGDCRHLAEAVENFRREFLAFDNRPDPANLYPKDSFWDARAKIEKALQQSEDAPLMRPLETIAQLRDQKVNDIQIAKIWNFIDRKKNPLPHLVQAELDNPGSITKGNGMVDGRDWVHPQAAEMADIEAGADMGDDDFDDDDAGEILSPMARKRKQAEEDKPQRCPETPRELWEQKVSVEQSAKMLLMPVAEVKEMFRAWDAEAKGGASGNAAGSTPAPIQPGVVNKPPQAAATTPATPASPPAAKQPPPPGGLLSGGGKQQAATGKA